MKYCPFCGFETAESARFCPRCGKEQPKQVNYTQPDTKEYEPDRTQSGKLNGFCLAGFICSIFTDILGLVFSLIGLSQAKKNGESGVGLAVAGTVISALKLFFSISLLLLIFFTLLVGIYN